MFSRPSLIARGIAAATLAALLGAAAPAHSAGRDKAFFDQISGQWKGPGEIVAGKYKGTKFTCDLTGEAAAGCRTASSSTGSAASASSSSRCRP